MVLPSETGGSEAPLGFSWPAGQLVQCRAQDAVLLSHERARAPPTTLAVLHLVMLRGIICFVVVIVVFC